MSESTEYEIRVTRFTVGPVGETIFSGRATTVEIDDEGGGEYVRAYRADTGEGLAIDPCEWPHIRNAIDKMIKECRL